MTDAQIEQRRAAGRRTAEKHGAEHMRCIGKRGFVALARRLGDNGAAVSYLQAHQGLPKRARAEWAHNAHWNIEG